MSQANSKADIKAIVLDIEGTVAPISFVHETLFPYARDRIANFIHEHADNDIVRNQIAATKELVGHDMSDDDVISTLINWIDEDRKAGPLKRLQGMIWAEGYADGALQGPIYSDAAQEMQHWHENGMPLYVYSSGSVQAQKLIFGHSDQGDLTMLLSGYYDTEVGPKRETRSYHNIQTDINMPSKHLLFLSDTEAELDAANEAGWHTAWIVRDANCDENPSHPQFVNFRQVAEDFEL